MADYTQLTDPELAELLYQYDLGEMIQASSLDGGQANSSLKIATKKGQFTLSICDEKNEKEIQTLTDVLIHLESHHFPTTRLVKTKRNRSFTFYQGKPVYVKKFLSGNVVAQLSCQMTNQVGSAMTQLHGIPPLPSMAPIFPYGMEAIENLLNTGFSHDYLDWLAEKKTYLKQTIDPDMSKGFIHGDIFWDNLLFENQTLAAILDFEEACHYYRLFDIGMAAVGCCSNNGHFDFSQIDALLNGYSKKNPFTSQEKSQINIFIEYAAVCASLWRFKQYNILRPDPSKADNFKELTSLADQIHTMNNLKTG